MPKGEHERILNPEHFSEKYDPEGDTFYVTFMTGEPSYCVEIDDVLIAEVGMFTKLPTGFRILNFSKTRPAPAHRDILIKLLAEKFRAIEKPSLEERQAAAHQALEKVLA